MVKLENTSREKEIKNLTATLESGEQLALLEATDTKLIGDIPPGGTVEFPVRLQAGEELPSASLLLGMSLKFDYGTEKGLTQGTYGEKIVIPADGGSKNKMGVPTPNIIISNYSYGETVSASGNR